MIGFPRRDQPNPQPGRCWHSSKNSCCRTVLVIYRKSRYPQPENRGFGTDAWLPDGTGLSLRRNQPETLILTSKSARLSTARASWIMVIAATGSISNFPNRNRICGETNVKLRCLRPDEARQIDFLLRGTCTAPCPHSAVKTAR